MNDSARRILRTLIQLIAGGALGSLATQIVLDVPDRYDPYILLASAAIAAIAQIVIEEWRKTDIGVKRVGPHGG